MIIQVLTFLFFQFVFNSSKEMMSALILVALLMILRKVKLYFTRSRPFGFWKIILHLLWVLFCIEFPNGMLLSVMMVSSNVLWLLFWSMLDDNKYDTDFWFLMNSKEYKVFWLWSFVMDRFLINFFVLTVWIQWCFVFDYFIIEPLVEVTLSFILYFTL